MNARMQSEMSHRNRRLPQMPWRRHPTDPGIEALSSLPIVTPSDIYMLYAADEHPYLDDVRLSHPPYPTIPELRSTYFRNRFSQCMARFPSNNQVDSESEGGATVAGAASLSTAVLEPYDIDLTYEWFKEVRIP